jgi:hypothetical protein
MFHRHRARLLALLADPNLSILGKPTRDYGGAAVSLCSRVSRCAVDSDAIPCEHNVDEIPRHCPGGSHAVLLSSLRAGILWRGGGWQSSITA